MSRTTPKLSKESKYKELAEFSELRFDRVEDERGSRYVYEVAVWDNLNSKRSDATRIDKEGKDRVEINPGIFADGAARFNICYDLAGIRIVEYDVRGVIHWRRIDTGELVPREKVITLDRQPEWEREKFTRDLQAEARECYDRWRLRRLEDDLLAVKPDQRGTTYAGQVAVGNADAREIGNDGFGFSSTDSLDYIKGHSSEESRRNCGFYFAGTLPAQGSTINSATLQLYCWPPGGDDLDCTIHAHDVDATTNFASNADVTGRARTTAGVVKTTTNSPAGFVSLTGLSSVAQEVVDRASFNGSAMTMLAIARTVANTFYMEMYESSSAKAAKLDIDYSAPASGSGMTFGRSATLNRFGTGRVFG